MIGGGGEDREEGGSDSIFALFIILMAITTFISYHCEQSIYFKPFFFLSANNTSNTILPNLTPFLDFCILYIINCFDIMKNFLQYVFDFKNDLTTIFHFDIYIKTLYTFYVVIVSF